MHAQPTPAPSEGAPSSETAVWLDRVQRSELERLQALVEVERIQTAPDADSLLRGPNIERAKAILAARAANQWAPGTPLMALVPTRIRLDSGADRDLPSMSVVTLVERPGTNLAITVRWQGATARAFPAHFAPEAEIVQHLEQRIRFVEEQLRQMPDQPDTAATARIERYELQLERLKETLRLVRATFQRAAGSAPRPSSPSPGSAPGRSGPG